MSGIQIEVHWNGVRETASGRQALADALAEVLDIYMLTHFSIDWNQAPPESAEQPRAVALTRTASTH